MMPKINPKNLTNEELEYVIKTGKMPPQYQSSRPGSASHKYPDMPLQRPEPKKPETSQLAPSETLQSQFQLIKPTNDQETPVSFNGVARTEESRRASFAAT